MTKHGTLPSGLVEQTLVRLGIDIQEDRHGELWALCPGHKANVGREDRKASWSINEDTGLHSCFSCGYKGNVYTLVRDIRGVEAAQEFRDDSERLGFVAPEGFFVDRDLKPWSPDKGETKIVSEYELATFSDPPKWALEKRRISLPASSLYGVRWDEDSDSWILPYRDPETGDFIGYQIKSEKTRMFRNVPPGSRKDVTLFGYREVLDETTVVLVESPLDAVMLYDLGYPALAVCGSHLSEEQLELLSHFEYVVVALDNDEAGNREVKRLSRMLLGFKWWPVEYPPGISAKDVGDMDMDSIFKMLERSVN